MQFSLRMSTLLTGLIVLLSLQAVDSLSLSIPRTVSKFHTLPLRRMESRSDIHPQILLQMRINRGIRRLAKMTGSKPPSAQSLEERLEKRLLSVDISTDVDRRYNRFDKSHSNREIQLEKRFNRAGLRPKRQEQEEPEQVTPANPPTNPNSLGLSIVGSDEAYSAIVQMGTPPQNFSILMDSGSADLWVGSEMCTTVGASGGQGCGNHIFLGPKSSSTFIKTSNSFTTSYGIGNVSGPIVRDDVNIAGLSLVNHTFGVADQETENFSDFPPDGLMGLAKSSISMQQTPTPIEVLASAGFVSSAIVSYKLSRLADNKNDGEITFGGLDDSKFIASTLVTVPNVNPQGFWEAKLERISVNDFDLKLIHRTTILDTGTTVMIVPPADAVVIHENIPGAQPDGQGGFTVPCTTNATVALTYASQMFTIDPRDLAVEPVDPNNPGGSCVSGIASGESSNNQKEWLVGDTFLKNAYFSTNLDKNTISLAKLA